MPKISVIMPTYNSDRYVAETIQSVLNQTFTNFEFLIINEFGSNDRTVEIANSFGDPRIRIIQNSKREGLAESLNIGIREAKGKYIARVDADDLYESTRFEEQVKYLDEHKDVSVLGTWQKHYGGSSKFVHRSKITPEDVKASLLFDCDLCHSTLMFRREDFIKNNLFYKTDLIQEDYELWTRACHVVKFANLPKILGYYRISDISRTNQENSKMNYAQTKTGAIQLEKFLNIKLQEDDYHLLYTRTSPILGKSVQYIKEYLKKENDFLKKIWDQNKKLKVYDENSLIRAIKDRWDHILMFNTDYSLYKMAFFLSDEYIKYETKVSVIMPIGLSTQYLEESVGSILCQSLCDFELITVVDYSNNDAIEILNKFNDSRIKFMKCSNNGKYADINSGIKAAQGKYIAFMDAEEISLPKRLEQQILCLEENTSVDICGTCALTFDEDKNYKELVKPNTDKDIKTMLLLGVEGIIPSTLMFRKDKFEKFKPNYSQSSQHCADCEFLNKAADFLSFYNVPAVLQNCRNYYQNINFLVNDSSARKEFLNIVQTNISKKLDINIPDNLIEAFWPYCNDNKIFSYEDLIVVTDLFKQVMSTIISHQDFSLENHELQQLMITRLNYLLTIVSKGLVQQDYHNKDKKILIVSHELSNTGAPLILLPPIEVLQKHGYSITLLSYVGGPLEETLKKMQVPVIISPESFSNEELFTKIANPFALVLANTVLTYPVIKFLKKQNKVIWWLHEGVAGKELVSKLYPEAFSVLSAANNIYAVSKYSLSEFIEYNSNISVLTYGFEDKFVKARTKPKQKNDKIKFLMLGSIEQRKAHDIVLNAIELLPDEYKNQIQLDITGESTDTAWCNSIVDAHKHLCNVKWHGFVSVDKKNELLADADLLLCVSWDDPEPKVVAEAMMMAKPCVVSKNVGQYGLISDSENGFLVETGSPISLKEKIIEIINLKDKLSEIGKQSREIYLQNYTSEIFEKKLIDVVNKTLKECNQTESIVNKDIDDINSKKLVENNLNYISSEKQKITVAYLAYFNEQIGYGLDVVENFLNLYKKYKPGAEHELVILAKNWTNKDAFDKLCALAVQNDLKIIYLPDDGFDIGAYFRASHIIKSEYVYFIGSNIEICADNWLKYSYNAFKKDKSIGLVGPMGSYEEGKSGVFPNPHIRTTCFMLKNELFKKYAASNEIPQTKEDTWELEHCAKSLSNFVVNSSLALVVVNSDGEIFYPESWPYSQTYINENNKKALMSDKWSRRYVTAEDDFKPFIEKTVWGENTTIFLEDVTKDFAKNLTIFTPYSDRFGILHSDVFHPILVGKFIKNLKTEVVKADSLINIADKYDSYGDLVAYYWVWKNFLPSCKQKYVGFNQICRALDYDVNQQERDDFIPVYKDEYNEKFANYSEDNILKCIEDYDVVIPYKTEYKFSVYEQYLLEHSKADFDIALDVIEEFFPKYVSARNEVLSSNYLYGMCAFVMRKELLDEFFTWLFDLLEKIEACIKNSNYGEYKDIFSSIFMAERLFNIWLVHKINKDGIKVKYTSSYTIYFNKEEYDKAIVSKPNRTYATKG